ncbi:MAG TPA: universal stress protein [Povalibacter sp.]|uniref:universal stress protein n=1 Tax=Povalibacter sp. TaxID=1962978 RepID=UPI002C7D9F62|nr:universal stress protein [Povalibacter sp.]HMN43844.1 universal stress protein [Povalibacter sp.]
MATRSRRSAAALLVAMDGSENALRALKLALAWARQRDQAIHIVHVQPRIKSSRLMPRSLIEEHYERQSQAAFKPARELVKRTGVTAVFDDCLGDPAATLAAYAKKYHCEQIVLGNRGHGAIATLFLGSVAMKVLHLADVPVTLVK